MKTIQLNALQRTISNKQAIKTLRREDRVPCVLYGEGIKDNILFSVDKREAAKIIYTPSSYIIEIVTGEAKYLCTLHAMQFHPLTDEPLHIDFLAVADNKPVTIEIPVVLKGNPEGVKQGGKLSQPTRKLLVSGMIDSLPDTLDVNVSKLKLGKNIVAGDLSFNGLQILSSKKAIICSVKMTRVAIGAAAAAAQAAAAEGTDQEETEGGEES